MTVLAPSFQKALFDFHKREISEYFLIESIQERKALIIPVLCKQNYCLAFEN